MEQDVWGLVGVIVGVITLIVASLTLFLTWFIDRQKQLRTLRSLYQYLDFIKTESISQRNAIRNVNGPIPSWTTMNIDLTFYISNIHYRVRKEWGCNYIPTKELKDGVLRVAKELNDINNFFSLMRSAIAQGTRTGNGVASRYRAELAKRGGYYEALDQHVEKVQRELRSILVKKKVCVRSWY